MVGLQLQNLASYRRALRQLDGLQPSDQRRAESRFAPTGPLSKARVCISSNGQDPLDADVVDLSPSGMRLAVGPGHACCEGDQCEIELVVDPQQRLALVGEVRWVKHHPYITVFGVLLDPESASGPRV